jgi:hypothetical protein
MRRAAPTLAAIGLGLALVAAPTAARADDEADRREAKALLREGNRLLQDAQDPAGALSLFVAAYAKFPSDKILVSIGSAERALGHDGAAANAYARFVASPDATADQAREARKLLATLDSKLGRVTVTVTPSDRRAPARRRSLGAGGRAGRVARGAGPAGDPRPRRRFRRR